MSPSSPDTPAGGPVAVIGIGCIFPKASDLKSYWRLLLQGVDAISDVPPSHWSAGDYFHQDPKTPDHVYCTRGGFLPPIAFDPSEFGIPPATLETTDTSQLLGLLAAKMAIEDAGYGDGKPFDRDRTSVILGVTGTQELVIPLGARLGHPVWRRALAEVGIPPSDAEAVVQRISDAYVPWRENSFPGLLGNVVAGRISNRLDLGGTNCVVDAACASSLSALHLAMLELQTGRSDMVLSGGVDTLNDIFMHMCFAKTLVLSASGDARPFAAGADGTVLGEGIGILVLKRLADAERDGDRIYAVIKGIGSASDGKSQSIYAPRMEGQVKALRAAYERAGIDPVSVGMVEAHGTGTRVGDRVEFQALCEVFGRHARKDAKTALGSVKSMIGHTKAAAGAAGMIKSVLALHHKVLPPTLKADEPDPRLGLDDSPFYLNSRSRPWIARPDGVPRRAGVSAFGFGGSNFHVVLEEYGAAKAQPAWDGCVDILAVCGADRSALTARLRQIGAELEASPGAAAYLAAQSRAGFSPQASRRLLMAFDPATSLSESLSTVVHALESGRDLATIGTPAVFFGDAAVPGKLALLFPGQGSQYVDMGVGLVCTFPTAMEALEKADGLYEGDRRLSELIFPPVAGSPEKANRSLRPTEIAQPAIGAVSLAMLDVLRYFGVKADAACGHSLGELTALHAAGWIDADTLLRLAVIRGHAMAEAGGKTGESGAMLAVHAPLDEIETRLLPGCPGVVLANRNSPNQGVLSGPRAAIEKAARACADAGFKAMELPVSAAFHSESMRAAQKPFSQAVRQAAMTPSPIPVFATATAEPYPADRKRAAELLAGQLTRPVNFVRTIENLYDFGARTFLEVGPKSVLSKLVRATLPERAIDALAMDASAGRRPATEDLARVLCRLAAMGYAVQLDRWDPSVTQNRRPRMQVRLHGANYRPPATEENKARPRPMPNFDSAGRTGSRAAADTMPKLETIIDQPPATRPPVLRAPDESPMKKDPTSTSDNLVNALDIVQEGLKSIQALQAQTAQAHQKFLETQAEASRTLQAMMASTQRLAEAALGLTPAPASSLHPDENAPTPSFMPENVPTILEAPRQSENMPAASSAAPTPPPTEAMPSAGHRPQASSVETAHRLTEALVEVVSELTGYPREMVGLDMDIEADLGIDSIKRVEILSTLEEKVPGLPQMAPEVMGTLKTLGEIVAFLEENSSAAAGRSDRRLENAAAAAPNRPGAPDEDALTAGLLAVVSELTGYPREMLGLDMDIEADLGIDSIKRVEILSTLEEKVPGLPQLAPEMLGALKTLREIVRCLREGRPVAESTRHLPLAASLPAGAEHTPPVAEAEAETLPPRYVVRTAPVELSGAPDFSPAPNRKIFITDDRSGLAQAIADELGRRGHNTVLVSVDILDFKKELPPAAGLILLLDPSAANPHADVRHAFGLTRYLAPGLLAAAAEGGAVFAGVSRLDGAFGLRDIGEGAPFHGALAGLVKTAAIEWPAVCCRAVDVDPHWQDLRAAAAGVVDTLWLQGPVEIGLSADGFTTPVLSAEPYPDGDIPIDRGDVVVVSGGARGVTAAAVEALARRTHPAVIILGRSPLPQPQPGWLEGLSDERAIKAAILENEFNAQTPSPVQLETRYRQLTAAGEMTAALRRLEEITTAVRYFPVDIRDANAVAETLDAVRRQYGPIRAVIHGAGVLHDRLIVDKTQSQFDEVYDTKVLGLQHLLAACGEDPLTCLVVFSSISARLGNKGQADYAMANEVMNKMARLEAGRRPDCRVLAINWGPWEGGMVDSALQREFKRRGVQLIPVPIGARSMVRSMGKGPDSFVEVVIGGPLDAPADAATDKRSLRQAAEAALPKNYSLAFEREIDVESHPILNSHVIGGKPVMPLALMTEWFCHGALHENPGLVIQGLDDIRLLKGILFEGRKKKVRLLAGKIRKGHAGYEVDVELRNGFEEGRDIIHCRARAVLAEELAPPPVAAPAVLVNGNGYHRTAAEIYADILFHGRRLHGIRSVTNCSPDGMVARVKAAPHPGDWMKTPLRNAWIADPLILDAAFQMASLWCYEQHGRVSLPSYAASYRQHRQGFPKDGCTVVLEVVEAGRSKMRGDFTFLDESGTVVARLTGFEAVMDESLNRAFKPDYEASN